MSLRWKKIEAQQRRADYLRRVDLANSQRRAEAEASHRQASQSPPASAGTGTGLDAKAAEAALGVESAGAAPDLSLIEELLQGESSGRSNSDN